LRVAEVPQRRALSGDAHLERGADCLAEPRDLVGIE
jgi:hypothetical protein